MPPEEQAGPLGDRERVAHMLAAARDAVAFAEGHARKDVDVDRMLMRALINCVQEIGEAAARVSDEGRGRAHDVPWPQMVGMRHVLVHAYYNIDADALWRVVKEHLPPLVRQLEVLLRDWDQPADDQTDEQGRV